MAYLRPMIVKERYFMPLEQEVIRLLNQLIYHPLLQVLNDEWPEMQNSRSSPLVTAIKAGNVWYEDGEFKGRFNSTLTKALRELGATYNKVTQSWTLPSAQVPVPVKIAMADVQGRARSTRDAMVRLLDGIDPDTIDHASDAQALYARAVGEMEAQFVENITAAAAITIVPEITDATKKIIAEEWGQNLDLYIKGWAKESITKLRDQIQAPLLHGQRAESLERLIRDSYGQSRYKAKFLARQETGLLMSKFQEQRYRDIGSTEYRWSGANDARERPDHKALNGKIFSWDSPPVTDRKTGARNHPGEDFNCRCVAVGLI